MTTGGTKTTQEMAYNPRLNRKVLEEDFVKMMAELKLADPKMMDVAVPANQACGVTASLPAQFQRRVVKTVSFNALNALGDYRLIDVREAEEFDGPLGHLEQAELLPLSQVKEASQVGTLLPVMFLFADLEFEVHWLRRCWWMQVSSMCRI